MKKITGILAVLFILFFFSTLLSAETKQFVCIVKPVLDKDVVDSIVRIGQQFNRKEIEEYAKGGWGSGFIYIAGNGANYVITNRHVVAMAQKAELEFINEDGTSTVIKDCPVLYTDDEFDLAVLGIADNKKPFKTGLSISNSGVKDGDEVWAAGFPGLLGKPSWQLSKGNVSNNKVVVPEIANTDKEWFIQHTASIDPGNSGGPLLVKGKNDVYSVVGINTWTVSGRNNVFFSIPASSISEVIKNTEKTLAKDEKSKKDDLINTAKSFANSLSREKSSKNDFRFISYSYGVSNGAADLEFVDQAYDEKEIQPLVDKLEKGVFIEFWRHVKWERIKILLKKQMSKNSLQFKNLIGEPVKDETGMTARTLFLINKNEYIVTWKWEDGHWRVYDTDFDSRLEQRKTNYENAQCCANASNTCLTGGIIGITLMVLLGFLAL
ncbi:MAG: trypsin-like peptidase domain-containing protein [Spirochaetes bacterium]|nr:trypsin-like peptidase domain-containing protein [Spirochaetota bacterium]